MSNTAITTIPEISHEKLNSYLDAFGIATKLTAQERVQFIEIAMDFKLNPFKREIYAVKYGSSPAQIIVGYEVYLKRAEMSGQFDGCDTAFYTEDNDTVCQVTIYRKDWSRPLVHRCYLSEYNQSSNPLWKQKPKTMLRKVTVSQAYRMAFPCEFGGMPYTSDEVGIEDAAHQIVHEPATVAAVAATPAPVTYTKQQQAENSQAFLNWQNGIDTLPNLAESWTKHVSDLRALKGIKPEEKLDLFNKFKDIAFEKGFDYDESTRTFYAAEPATVTEAVAE